MYKKTIASILCVAIFWTSVFPLQAEPYPVNSTLSLEEIRQKYPDAKILQVSEEDYPEVARQLQQQGYRVEGHAEMVQLAQNQQADSTSNTPSSDQAEEQPATQQCDEQGSESSARVGVNIRIGEGSSSGSSRDNAAVVFVVVGFIMVVVWTLYFFKFLYDVSVGYHPCRWSELSAISSFISSDTQQHARFYGLNYATGIRDGDLEIGLAVEAGHSDILLVENSPLELNGLYWFLGPVLRWRLNESKNPHYFKLHFLGGSTEHDEMGVLAKAGFSLQFALSEKSFMGFNWGALHINLSEDQGIITERNQYHYLYGINFGMKF